MASGTAQVNRNFTAAHKLQLSFKLAKPTLVKVNYSG
jgi:hypothetical protein